MVRDGYFYGLALLVVAIAVYLLTGGWLWTLIPILLAIFFLWFFRDPERAIPEGYGLIVSPADGLVTEVTRFESPNGPRQRISIFLNVFNVHVNRSPISGKLVDVHYQKGKYLNAMNPASAEQNEQCVATVAGEEIEVTFKQIAGLLARRIVFVPKPGDHVGRGDRVGLIKFGSRVDVILPLGVQIIVTKGTKVKGGSSVLAEINAAAVDPLAKEATLEALV
jgi:phosphatidylserine decarboxylase